jgi:hypothetical protein
MVRIGKLVHTVQPVTAHAVAQMPCSCHSTACAKGKYQAAGVHAVACIDCPQSKTTSGTGATHQAECSAPICPNNQYQQGASCVNCPSGKTSSSGSTMVSDCKVACSSLRTTNPSFCFCADTICLLGSCNQPRTCGQGKECDSLYISSPW